MAQGEYRTFVQFPQKNKKSKSYGEVITERSHPVPTFAGGVGILRFLDLEEVPSQDRYSVMLDYVRQNGDMFRAYGGSIGFALHEEGKATVYYDLEGSEK